MGLRSSSKPHPNHEWTPAVPGVAAPRRPTRRAVWLAAALALGLAGCRSVGPDYTPPADASPAAWQARLPDGLTSGTADAATLAQWWTVFGDPVLNSLIEDACAANLDLRSAESRVRQARAQQGVSEAGLWPTLGSSASVTHSQTRSEIPGAGTQTLSTNLYRAGFDANWEVDVFGGQRRSVEAAKANTEAAQAAMYDTLVTLGAEVAQDYVGLRSAQTRLTVAEANLRAQKETLELVESRFQAQMSNELPVQQARYNYESTASGIPTLRASVNEALNRIAILLAQAPGAIHERLGERGAIPTPPTAAAVGVPSEMLRRRPDIRQAERQIAAQTARVGVAVADLYPKFNLSGALSRQGTGTQGFLESPVTAWSLAPSVSWDLFRGGALRQTVQVQNELKDQNLLAYQSAVLAALEEAENKIFALGQERERRVSLSAAVDAARSASELSQQQYMAGLVDFNDVLNAEQSLLSFQDQLAQSDAAVATDLISLFKALGGGWSAGASEGGPERKDESQ